MGIEAEEAEDNIATLANPEALAHFRDRQELTGRINMGNYLAQLGAWVTVVQGAIFVVCVLAFRRGVVGERGRFLKKSL